MSDQVVKTVTSPGKVETHCFCVSTVSEGDTASPEEVPVFLETEDHTFQGLTA